VADALGEAVCSKQLPPGTVLSAETVCSDYGVSRTVAREALRELQTLGMVAARQQIGTTVLPEERWNLFSPRVIAWRSRCDYSRQTAEVLQMRLGLEPVAAGLAAAAISSEQERALTEAWQQLRDAAREGDVSGFVAADIAFHRCVYVSSGNALVAQFAVIMDAVFSAWQSSGPPVLGEHTAASVRRHGRLLRAITTGDVRAAERAARALVSATIAEPYASAPQATAAG